MCIRDSHPDAPKGVTAFGIQIQATGNSQKLRNNVLRIPIQPGRALHTRFTSKMYGRFQSILSNIYGDIEELLDIKYYDVQYTS